MVVEKTRKNMFKKGEAISVDPASSVLLLLIYAKMASFKQGTMSNMMIVIFEEVVGAD